MSLQHFGKGALRVAKNYTKGYSDTQAKVRDATSNDPWGPSGTQMNEIAQLTYNQQDFVEIMEMLDKRLNDKGKNWRHVFKALTVLDYCLHAGSENVVIYFRDNMYIVKTLKEFTYIDEYDKDQGANVRQKAKDITNLLMDESRLREERRSRAHMRDRMVGGRGEDGEDDDEAEARRNARERSEREKNRRRPAPQDDDELKRAIEESKRSLQEEQAKQGRMTAEERDLAAALRLSEDEEASRRKALDDSNQKALFDEGTQLSGPSTNPFPLVDINQLQAQPTIQPQFTSFNPYAAQLQAQQQAMQDEWNRQQQELFMQQQAQAQAQAQQEEYMRQQQQQAMQEEYMRQQFQLQQQQQAQQFFQQQQQQAIQVQPTGYGSNNPFALGGNAVASPPPPLPSSSPANFQSSFSPPSLSVTAPQRANSTSPSPTTQDNTLANARRAKDDGEHAHLANLFANREDGLDSFGNIGNLRYGHQHAAPFVAANKTGQSSNPFGNFGASQQQQQQQNEQPFFSI